MRAEKFANEPRVGVVKVKPSSQHKDRFQAYGTTERRRYPVVVYTHRRGLIRPISAYPMNRSTRKNMPRNSKKTSKDEVIKMPRFASEAEEADWWSSPEVRKFSEREFERGLQDGTLKVYPNGMNVKRTDPKVLQDLMDRVKSKKTKSISIRIPVSEIEAAKALGERAGVGYQTVLKQIIQQCLRAAR